jgi:hypothetical protein
MVLLFNTELFDSKISPWDPIQTIEININLEVDQAHGQTSANRTKRGLSFQL